MQPRSGRGSGQRSESDVCGRLLLEVHGVHIEWQAVVSGDLRQIRRARTARCSKPSLSKLRGLHMQLLPRLAAFRGRWQNDRLQGALSEAIEHLRTPKLMLIALLERKSFIQWLMISYDRISQTAARNEIAPETGIALAVALLLGGRLTMAATGGAVCMIFGQVGQSDGNMDNLEVVGSQAEPTTHCAVLEDSHLGALLTVNGVRSSGLSAARMRALARSHTMGDRPRAGCVSLLEEAQKSGAQAPLVAAAVRFSWSRGDQVKKQRTDPSNLTKVRCRHLLLRHVGCQAPLGDRRKKPTRSLGDAELQMLRILPEVAHGGAAAFTKKCKELSECDTAMKSGDLSLAFHKSHFCLWCIMHILMQQHLRFYKM